MVYLQVMMNWQRPDPWGKYLFVQEFPVAILIHETPELFLGFHFRNSVARLVSTGGLIAQAGGLTLRVIDKSAPLFLHHAAQLLPVATRRATCTSEPRVAEQRLDELAYLANVLIAGSSRGGQPPRPIEALERALEICSVGLKRALGRPSQESAEAPLAGRAASVLARISADLLFRLGFDVGE
jgi:hypothetical protein